MIITVIRHFLKDLKGSMSPEKWVRIVLYPGKGECADPVNEDAILKVEGGGESQDRDRERQLVSDSGGGKT